MQCSVEIGSDHNCVLTKKKKKNIKLTVPKTCRAKSKIENSALKIPKTRDEFSLKV